MADSGLLLSVVGYSPRLGLSENVGPKPDIKIRFNIPVNVNLVNTDASLNQYASLFRLDTDESIALTFKSWDANNRILIINPVENLAPGEVYQVTIRRGLESAEGRRMERDKVWVFQTDLAPLSQVSLREPGADTAWPIQPSLSWNGVYIPSGSVFYQVQVDDSWAFKPNLVWSTTVTVSGSGGIHAVAIGTPLAARTTYYWRVRAYTESLTGDWSETRAFFLGTAKQAAPDTVQLFDEDATFRVTELLPENGLSHLTAFPTIRATFTIPVSGQSITDSTFPIFKKPLATLSPPGTVQLSGNTYNILNKTVEVIPPGTIEKNTRYTVRLTQQILSASGTTLEEEIEVYFAGAYQPLYGDPLAVRAELGSFVNAASDDEILFHLWRASLHINELLITRIHRLRPTANINDLVNYQPAEGLTWGMMRYAELTAAMHLLDGYYYDLLQSAGRERTLAVLTLRTDVELLEEIRNKLKELKTECDQIGATFLAAVVVPRTTIKSKYWDRDPCSPLGRDDSWPGRSGFGDDRTWPPRGKNDFYYNLDKPDRDRWR